MRKRIAFFFTLALLLLAALPAGAAPPPEPMPPVPPEWNFDGLTIEYQRVDVTVENQIATTHIDQLFVNDADWMAEGIYLFPLPAGATVTELVMWVDGEAIEAQILDAGEAREVYDEIVRQLRDPALLEYIGTGAIQANVFPIPAHDERRIEIEYTQVLPAENGLFHYVFPQSTNLYTNLPLDSQSIRVDITSDEELHTIYSPSHAVAVNRETDFHAIAGYEADNVVADTDFELYYTVSPEEIGLNLVTYKEPGQDGFFLLMAAPTVEVDPDEVVAKDIILVLDTSGSMHGEKLDQAKEAALFVVDNLNDQDRFNIITFSTGVRNFAPELVSAAEPGGYQSFVNSIEAIGGTNISLALLEAVNQANAERPTTIIFMTDGLATEGIIETPAILDSVAAATPANVRIFAFGVGDDVDTLLLDSLTEAHRGTTSYVRPNEAIDEEIGNFYVKISSPVLANIELDFGDIVVEQMYPNNLPDLFAGSQLILVGRYREGGPATIRLTGEVNGRTETFVYEDNTFRSNGGDDFIPRLWATRAIGHLLNEIRLHGETQELVDSIVTLSVRYGIITPYTSFLITEDDIFSQSSRDGFAEEAMDDMDFADEVSGGEAVEEAEAAADLAGADTAAPAPTAPMTGAGSESGSASNQAVQYAGSKTFVYRNGVWIDTSFDSDTQEPQQVGFASDNYFALLDAAPELGQYFALGERVLVVYNGIAYEIVDGSGDSNVTLPDPDAVPEVVDGNTGVDTNADTTGSDPTVSNQNEGSDAPAGRGVCASPLLLPIFFGLVLFTGRRRKK